MKRLVRTIGGIVLLSMALPAFAQVTDEDIDRARAEVRRLTDESAELGQDVIDAYGRQASLNSEIDSLRSSIDFAEVQMTDTEARLEKLAVELYMGSTSGRSLSMLFSATNQDYPAGMEYLREASGVDDSVVTQMRVLRDELDRQTVRLGEALDEQETLTVELEEMAGQLQNELVSAQQVYDDLVVQQQREEEERRRREEEERRRVEEERRRAAEAEEAAATDSTQPSSGSDDGGSESPATTSPPTTSPPSPPPAPSGGGGVCPVAGAVSFTDSWGAPRSGGRSHKGVDMIAARGVPIVAIYSGRIQRTSNSTLGGKSVYFISDAGDMYYYAHLDDFGDISSGQSVAAGYVLGYNGSTGNAPNYLPHLHFQYHPGGGSPVNPYPLVRSLC